MKKTYGVANLIDWNAVIPTGKAHLSVRFCGGAVTKFGITPAEYTTSDPVVQKIIENSQYFKKGRIFIVK